MTLAESLDRADRALTEVSDATEVGWVVTDNKTQLLVEYFSAALEHYTAIVFLIRNDLRGSALALIRPVYDAFYRALWVQACAQPDDVGHIKDGSFRFPFMKKMIGDVDAALKTEFSNITNLSWDMQNDFTHTGKSQRIGRATTRGEARIEYPDEGMVAQLDSVTLLVIMFASILLKVHGHTAAGERLDRLAASFK